MTIWWAPWWAQIKAWRKVVSFSMVSDSRWVIIWRATWWVQIQEGRNSGELLDGPRRNIEEIGKLLVGIRFKIKGDVLRSLMNLDPRLKKIWRCPWWAQIHVWKLVERYMWLEEDPMDGELLKRFSCSSFQW